MFSPRTWPDRSAFYGFRRDVNDWLANLIADSVTPATDRIVDAREPRRRLSLKEVGCTSHWL